MKNPAAVALGQASWKKRAKGRSKKQISSDMSQLAQKRYAIDKTAIPNPNA
jgi:hypothetical protein